MIGLKPNVMVTCLVSILVEDVSIHVNIDNDTHRGNLRDVELTMIWTAHLICCQNQNNFSFLNYPRENALYLVNLVTK
jgi:hypothetical protein